MKYKIVSDSTSNLLELPGEIEYITVPLKINVDGKEYIDEIGTDIPAMVNAIEHSVRNSTSCPNSEEYKMAYEGADNVFAVTITSGLSGSYNAAVQGAEMLKEEFPDVKIKVIDSLSTGGEMHLLILAVGLKFQKVFNQGRSCREKRQSSNIYLLDTLIEAMIHVLFFIVIRDQYIGTEHSSFIR